MVFIIMNSLVLFVIMQILGVPISNLALLKQKYDTFSFSEDKTTSGINIIYTINQIFCDFFYFTKKITFEL